MGFRDRLKNRVANLFVGPTHSNAPTHSPSAAQTASNQKATPPKPAAPKAAAPKAAAPKAAATPKPTPPKTVKAEPAKDPVDAEQAEKDAKMAKKAAKHLEKTRRAMLKLVIEKGGSASLGDLHDLSERRYFIGHKRFSDMMEALTEEDLLTYDSREGTATITDEGRSYLEADA